MVSEAGHVFECLKIFESCNSAVADGAGGMFLQVILMIFFGGVKFLSWNHLCNDVVVVVFQFIDEFVDGFPFIFAAVENRGSVLRADVRALAV